MSTSTVDHATYVSSRTVAPEVPRLRPNAVPDERANALRVPRPLQPDPDARGRMAAILYQITGWETFGGDERAYVSRLWGEDWDSPEDSVYDEP